MAETEFALNDPLAVQRWSTSLAVQANKGQYFIKFMGSGDDALIKVKSELSKQKGEKIIVALRMKLSGDGIEGDNDIEGTDAEEALSYFNDYLYIDQRRKGTKSKGKMSEQRVPYDIRKDGHDALAGWYGEDYDEQLMMYLAGARGVDTSFHVPVSFTGRANNGLQAPDAYHYLLGGDATASTRTSSYGLAERYSADLDSSDKMALSIVDKIVAKIETLDPQIQPFMIEGEKNYVFLMHVFQAYDLRRSTSEGDWLDIQKNAGERGKSNLIYRNALGEYCGVVLHKHRNVIRFADYGLGGNVPAGRALLLGAQAGMIAWGGAVKGVGRYTWNEETDDRGNKLVITAGSIYGAKKSRYNDQDFGVIAVDTYCKDPNV